MTCRDFNCPKNFSVSASVTKALFGLLASRLVLGTTLQLVVRLTVKLVLVVLAELLPPGFALPPVVSVATLTADLWHSLTI